MGDKLYEVILDGGGPWGFRLQGGKDFGTPLKIARITPGSKAAVKKVNPGDVILEINDSNIEGLTHMDAQNVIKNSGSVLKLKLKACNVKVLEQTEVIHSAGVDHKFNAKPRAFGAPTSPTSTTPSYQSPPPSQAPRPVVSAPKFSPAAYAQKKKEELENRKNQQNTAMEESDVLRMLKESNLSDEQKRARKQSGTFSKLETGLTDNNGGDLPPPPPELMGEQHADHVRPTFGSNQGGNQSKTFQKLQSAVASGEGGSHPSVFNRPAQAPQSSPSPSKYGPKGQTPTSVNPIPKAPMPAGPSFKVNAPAARSPTNTFGGSPTNTFGGATSPARSPARSPTGYQPPPGMPVSSPQHQPPQHAGPAAQKIAIRPTPQPVPGKVDTKNPLCAKCNECIMGPFVSAIGKTWHPDHFACASCATSLQNQGFVEEQGQLYCERCYNEFFAPKCATCGKSVVGNCVNAIGKAFHPEHFVCSSCGKSFGNQGFLVDSGNPYCESCYDESFGVKCAGCQRTITGGEKYVEAMDKNFHSTCFKCDICHVRLEGNSFFLAGGRTFCSQHKGGH